MMDFAKLKAEINADPLGVGYANMSDAAVARSLSVADRVVPGRVPAGEMLKWAALNDAIDKLEKAVGGSPDHRKVARAALLLLSSPHIDSLPLDDAEVMGMVQLLVQLRVFTQAEIDDLVARGNVTTSRGVEVLGANPTPSDVAKAKRS